jgi:dihydrofolate reductase
MSKVVAFTNVTLDGVMQAPGSPDEARAVASRTGGWATSYAAMSQAGGSTPSPGALLFGRRTYENFYDVWPKRKDSPFSAMLDNVQKYVASRTLKEPLPWMNSTLLKADPLVLGSGRRLFPEGGTYHALRLVTSLTTPNGVVVATYEPVEQP